MVVRRGAYIIVTSATTTSKFPSNLDPQGHRENYTQRQKTQHNTSQQPANPVSLSYEGTVLLCFPKRGWQGCQRTPPCPTPPPSPSGSREPWKSGLVGGAFGAACMICDSLTHSLHGHHGKSLGHSGKAVLLGWVLESSGKPHPRLAQATISN